MMKGHCLLSLYLVGAISCLFHGMVEARVRNQSNQLYHGRKVSQVEEVFRRLPSVADEVESVFEDALFYSAFKPSPPVDQYQKKGIENSLNRALIGNRENQPLKKGASKVPSEGSFLGASFRAAGVYGGDGNRKGGVRGAAGTNEIPPTFFENQFGIEEYESIREPAYPYITEKMVKSAKKSKSGKGFKSEKKIGKHFKKDKRYKGEKRDIDHKLNKSGKNDENFSYDPYDADDDYYPLPDEWSFDSWKWEWDEVDEGTTTESADFFESVKQYEATGTASGNTVNGWKIGTTSDAVDGMMGRMDLPAEEEFSGFGKGLNFVWESAEDEGNSPMALTSTKVDQKDEVFSLSFPSIQHMVFSGPIHIKAYSSVDLSTMDPEIFAVLSSTLTPYLQQTMGPTLHSYTMEVDYSPGHDKKAGKDVVVTMIDVACTFKVISDSIKSFREIDHIQASRWMHDFFSGPEMDKLKEALKFDNIPITDITFIQQDSVLSHPVDKTNVQTMSKTVTEANSQIDPGASSSFTKKNKKSSGGAMVGITLSVILVGLLFFMHYTGRLPSRAQVGEFSLSARDSLANTSKAVGKRIKNTVRRKGKEKGRHKRTFSGTFRRHPDIGIQKAKLQKKPARSEEYLDNASTSSSSDASGGAARESFNDMLDQDDYSFSHFAGDYEPSTYAPSTPSRRTEASRTDSYGYEPQSLFTKVSKKVSEAASLLNPGHSPEQKSPIPYSAPRRVTAADIASPTGDDNWSVRSFETKEKTPSNHPLYRGWNESGPQLNMESPKDSRRQLNIPRFSQK